MNTMKSQYDHDRAGSSQPSGVRAVEGSLAPKMAVFDSAQLFGSSSEIGILHQGSLYRLKITRQGKLILNK